MLDRPRHFPEARTILTSVSNPFYHIPICWNWLCSDPQKLIAFVFSSSCLTCWTLGPSLRCVEAKPALQIHTIQAATFSQIARYRRPPQTSSSCEQRTFILTGHTPPVTLGMLQVSSSAFPVDKPSVYPHGMK
ncbi:uncharacterized protein LY89DRAFT_306529 [Mollisia scopiformis]|uniref:Uncharacterized protein n=1 Tax=Mollisia scopiformis TaxID=149040 RepID=A0A194XSC0_MOLSC|nr:uncharacterized protein LY89DRAFT_306529 [Mollisia scopiformis]KUJ22627.1 hypothetical protein LY89DRAFT_306529 [Mollisia scopiformis]